MKYYIHGFGGNNGETQTIMKNFGFFPLTYDVENPQESIEKIEYIIKKFNNYPIIVASSLGCYFAEMINLPKDLILFNPSLVPKNNLKKYNISDEILNKYTNIEINYSSVKRVIIVSEDDEVLDCNQIKTIIPIEKAKYIYTTGGHRLIANPKNIDIILDEVFYLENNF